MTTGGETNPLSNTHITHKKEDPSSVFHQQLYLLIPKVKLETTY